MNHPSDDPSTCCPTCGGDGTIDPFDDLQIGSALADNEALLTKVKADARALRAVKILWRHALKHGTRHSFGASASLTGGLHFVQSVLVGATGEQGGLPRVFGRKHTQDETEGLAAFIAAAESLVAEDPTLGEVL